jgi:subfamily B ATP-binding cassette protein MsbA
MNRAREILALLKDFKPQVAKNIFYNILTTIFSVFSFASIVPFLKLLFNEAAVEVAEAPPAFSASSDDLLAWTDHWINYYIVTLGAEQALFYFCIFIVVIFTLSNLTRYLSTRSVATIRVGVVVKLRERIHNKILKLPLSYFSEERKGNIITKITSDVSEVEWSILGSIEMLFRDPLMIIIYFSMLVAMNWQLTVFVLITLPISALLISLVGKNLKSSADKGQGKLSEVLSTVEESLSGLRIIKAFNAEQLTQDKFEKNNNEYFKLMVKLYKRQYLGSPISEVLGASALAVIMWFGGGLILDKNSSFDGAFFITYIVFFSQLIPPAKSFSGAFFRIKKGVASLDRINEILLAEEIINEHPQALAKSTFDHSLSFKNVGFSYDDNTQVLKNINLDIKKGQMIALVGQSGGGKSTLADLIPRFYDISSGDLLLDDIPLNQIKIKDLRGLMGVVSQESVLFNDTVFNNIALGVPDAKLEDVEAAAKIANAHEFIVQLDKGYETNIGDSGNKLSGGQRQRLSIARAVLKNPPILILDEATSALDTESEKLVQDALEKLMNSRTSIVIAHRLSTIQHADEIVVLQQGEITERGDHATLLAKNGTYKKLFELQSFQ